MKRKPKQKRQWNNFFFREVSLIRYVDNDDVDGLNILEGKAIGTTFNITNHWAEEEKVCGEEYEGGRKKILQ